MTQDTQRSEAKALAEEIRADVRRFEQSPVVIAARFRVGRIAPATRSEVDALLKRVRTELTLTVAERVGLLTIEQVLGPARMQPSAGTVGE